MAKGDKANAQGNINQNQNRANDQYDVFRGDLQKTNPFQQGQVERANIMGNGSNNTGYLGLAATGGGDVNAQNNIRSIVGSAAPSINTSGPAYSGWQGLAANGGWSPTNTSSVNTDVAGLQNIGQTGGWENQDLSSVRGAASGLGSLAANTGYEDFAKTGGFNDADIANFRARSNSVIPSLYAQQNQELSRNANISSSNPAANTAARLSLARQGAQALGTQSLNTEGTLADQIRQNKLAGIAGVANTKLAGLTGQGQLSQNLGQSLAANKLYGFTGAANATTAMQNSQNAATIAALTGMSQIDAQNLAAQLSARGQNLSGNEALDTGIRGGQVSGLGGLTNLYGTSYAPYTSNQSMNLNALNSQTNANQGFANSYINSTQIPSDFETGLGRAGQIGGMVAGGLAGLGGAGNFLKPLGSTTNDWQTGIYT